MRRRYLASLADVLLSREIAAATIFQPVRRVMNSPHVDDCGGFLRHQLWKNEWLDIWCLQMLKVYKEARWAQMRSTPAQNRTSGVES